MKTVNSLLLVMLMALGILVLNRQMVDPARPAYFLPSDTLVYIDQHNGKEAVRRFLHSRLGRVLARLDYPTVMREFAGVDSSMGTFAAVNHFITLSRVSELVPQLFGRRLVIALFGKRSWYAESEGGYAYIRKHLLLICRPQLNGEPVETLLARHFPSLEKTAAVYGNHTIHRLLLPNGEPLTLSLVGGQLLLAFEERIVREALDTYENGTQSLWFAPEFQELIKETAEADRIVYCRVKQLQDQARTMAAFLPSSQERSLLYSFTAFPGIKAIGYGGWRQARMLRHRLYVQLDQDGVDGRIHAMVATTPTMNYSLPFVSRNVLLYYWSNSLELKLLWEMYVERVGADSVEVQGLQDTFRTIFGHDLQDVLEMIGTNVSILVEDSVVDSFVPIPDFGIFIRLQKTDGAEAAIQHALNHFGIQLKKGTYRNVDYYSWGIDPNESIQPVYTVYRDYLIVSNTLNVLKKILDTPVRGNRLVGSKGFRELDPGFQTLNNSVCYIDQGRLLYRVQEFVSWAGTMLAIQDRQAAERSKLLLDQLVDPLFWGLSMYEKSATRTYVEDDRIYIDTKIRLAN